MDFPVVQEMDSMKQYQYLLVELWENICILDCTNMVHVKELSKKFCHLMEFLHRNIPPNDSILYGIYQYNVVQLFSFIHYIRDIHNEHGYRLLTYSFLVASYDYEPEMTKKCIQNMINIQNNTFQHGSWRDICGLCNYVHNYHTLGFEHPLIDFCIEFMNETLRENWIQYQENGTTNNNVAKWVPRETSKQYTWLFDRLVIQWSKKYTYYLNNNQSNKSYYKSILKCKTKYRQMVSKLTSCVNIVEHKLCSKKAGSIEPSQIPCGALSKYWNIFTNQNYDYSERNADFQHRLCTFQNSHYILSLSNTPFFNHKIKTSNLWFPEHIDKYVKRAIQVVDYNTNNNESFMSSKMSIEIELLNTKWNHLFTNWSQGHQLEENALPVIDVHCSSFQDPQLHKAIGRACFLVQQSNIKRILFSCHVPIWINVENCNTFMSMVQTCYNSLHNELWVNTSLENTLALLGNLYPFVPYIIQHNGYCHIYGNKKNYDSLCKLLNNERYSIFSS
jgi:hypothetical protein